MYSPEFHKPPGLRPLRLDREIVPENYIEARVLTGKLDNLRGEFQQGETIRWSYNKENFLVDLWYWRWRTSGYA